MNSNTVDSEVIQNRTEALANRSADSLSTQDGGPILDLVPPFLVKTKTREEKEFMRQQFKKQELTSKDRKTYGWLQKIYARFSTSFMLENKAATARDHLGNNLIFFFLHTT